MSSLFNYLTGLNAWLALLAGIIASVTALVVFSKTVRRKFIAWLLRRRNRERRLDALVLQVESIAVKVDKLPAMQDSLTAIRHELTLNGGQSTKDFIARLEAHRRHQFWLSPRPAFECDLSGKNIMVSEAYCVLVGANSESALLNLDWRQFVDVDDEPAYFASFRVSAGAVSAFRGVIRLTDLERNYRGRWEVRALPLGPSSTKPLFSGTLRPVDEVAAGIAREHRWECPFSPVDTRNPNRSVLCPATR